MVISSGGTVVVSTKGNATILTTGTVVISSGGIVSVVTTGNVTVLTTGTILNTGTVVTTITQTGTVITQVLQSGTVVQTVKNFVSYNGTVVTTGSVIYNGTVTSKILQAVNGTVTSLVTVVTTGNVTNLQKVIGVVSTTGTIVYTGHVSSTVVLVTNGSITTTFTALGTVVTTFIQTITGNVTSTVIMSTPYNTNLTSVPGFNINTNAIKNAIFVPPAPAVAFPSLSYLGNYYSGVPLLTVFFIAMFIGLSRAINDVMRSIIVSSGIIAVFAALLGLVYYSLAFVGVLVAVTALLLQRRYRVIYTGPNSS